MSDSFSFTLHNPLTDDEWDMITDVDFEHTNEITFYTKHGKEVRFFKASADVEPVKHGRWIEGGYACGETEWICSECGFSEWRTSNSRMKFCMNCGARMDGEQDYEITE